MPTSPRHIFSSDSGQSILEIAVSLPLFLILIAGTGEIANLAWASVQVNNAARAGAAYASQSRANAANNANILLAARDEAPKLTITLPAPPTESCSCVSSTDGSSTSIACDNNALTNCPSTAGIIQVAVQVNVQATVTPFVHYLGLPGSYTVNAQATTGVQQ